jgi:hypothetical protein
MQALQCHRPGGRAASLAADFLKYEHYAAAEPVLRESLEIRIKVQANVWSTFNAKSMLGASLLGQKKYTEAELQLVEGYEGMKKREKTMPPPTLPRLTEAVERLVQLYEATGNAAEADRFRKELEARKAAAKTSKK